MGVLADPKYRLHGYRGLVGLLGAVAEPHERKEEEVDFPAEAPHVRVAVFGLDAVGVEVVGISGVWLRHLYVLIRVGDADFDAGLFGCAHFV
jgi:hypothetical protein